MSERAIKDVQAHLAALARLNPTKRAYRIRVCDHKGRRFFDLCLAADDWRTICITASGWSVSHHHAPGRERDGNVPLIRNDGMAPAVLPDRKKQEEAMRMFHGRCVDAGISPEHEKLLLSFMLAAWRSAVPGPVLLIVGEYGSGKTELLRLVKQICDPTVAGVRAMPKDARDLALMLASERLAAFDDVEQLSEEIRDLLKQNATGITVGERRFLQQRDVLDNMMQSVVAMTSKHELFEAADLGSRALVVRAQRTGRRYRPMEDLEKEDLSIRAGIMAWLCDASVAELHYRDQNFAELGRMADFERNSRAAAPGWGWTDAELASLFRAEQVAVQRSVAESDTLFVAILDALDKRGGLAGIGELRGTPSQLWAQLMDFNPQYRLPGSGFPQSPAWFSRQVYALAAALAGAGVTFRETKAHNNRKVFQFRLATVEAAAFEEPPVPLKSGPTEPCPGCGGFGWWSDDERQEWHCLGCEPPPKGRQDLRVWPPN